eukprot:CAMPEP_0119009734 /NCGR_PEP_ID=MMETSP1176-20130426/4570_1 /TAXON_ID=265551 /ORGANISM="Synedropsis recta cf, Strain CCMP1620" /LENGTH=156 /DNA_ID=CAMNT_0006962303 /DNA_START=317 /DNA_END=787 /DNA_ORIENTATION=-
MAEQHLLTVLRSCDAEKIQLEVCLATTTLADLKNSISHAFLQHHPPKTQKDAVNENTVHQNQRIFHLGRELKSSGRSLEKLGIGRFRNNMVLHLHLAAPKQSTAAVKKQQQLLSNSSATGTAVKRPAPPVIDLVDDDDDDDEVAIVESPGKRQRIV